MVKAQEWLEKKYPKKEQRINIKKLDIGGRKLEGELTLEGFINLEELICWNNQLIKLDVSDCFQLIELWCSNNQLKKLKLGSLPNLTKLRCEFNFLTNLDFLASLKNVEKLVTLSVANNNLSQRDLSFVNGFTGLEKLHLGTTEQKKINQDIYNRFFGSLEPLQELVKLEELAISNTNISEGLGLLRDNNVNLKEIYCLNYCDSKFGCKKIQEELKEHYNKSKKYYDFRAWREKQTACFETFSFSDSLSRSPSITATGSIFSFSSIFSSSAEKVEVALQKEIEDLVSEKKKLINELEEIKKELTMERQLRESAEEKLSFQQTSIEAQQETINTQKQLIASLTKNSVNSVSYRNILLIGRVGSGKSTVANVLLNKNNQFEEIFEESPNSVGKTKDIQVEEFEHEGVKYRIIDTPGFGDTNLTEQEILDKIAETAYLIKDGINQILFIVGGRFGREELQTYEIPTKKIFDKIIAKYTTIVRTNFPHFNNEKECENDRQKLLGENKELGRVFDSIKIIYVNNEVKKSSIFNGLGKNSRKESRKKLLKHLQENCQDIYKPQTLEELNARIGTHMKKIEVLQKNPEEEERNKEIISQTKESIRQETLLYMGERGVKWKEWTNLSFQGMGAAASIAALVVTACKIM